MTNECTAIMSGPTPTSKPRNDFKIVQYWISIARFLAIAPLDIQSGPKKDRSCSIVKIYPSILCILYLAANIFSFHERFFIYKRFNVSQVILDILQGVIEWILIESIVISSIIRKNKWTRVVKRITMFEQKLHWNFDAPVKDSNWTMIKLEIFLYHLVYTASHMYDSVANWGRVSYTLAFVIFRFTTYYIMFSTIFMALLCTWLKNRYLYLDNFLKEYLCRNKFKFVVLDKEPVCVYYDKLKEFSHHYKSLYLIVQDVNGIFGYQIFFISICTVLEILNAVNYGMPTIKNIAIINDDIFVNALYWVFYVMCKTRIVMACDSVEKCGAKIRKTCLILHESSEKYELKEELYMLANYVQGLGPEFSAAGFWQVNQRVLSTLFTSVMTYLIIIIQFNGTLQ